MTKSFVWTSIVTYIVIPVWFFALCWFRNHYGKGVNTPGLILYMLPLLAIGVFMPFFICFHIVPYFRKKARNSRMKTFLFIAGVHGLVLFGMIVVFWIIPNSEVKWTQILLTPFYLLAVLTPPSLAGCAICTALGQDEQPLKP